MLHATSKAKSTGECSPSKQTKHPAIIPPKHPCASNLTVWRAGKSERGSPHPSKTAPSPNPAMRPPTPHQIPGTGTAQRLANPAKRTPAGNKSAAYLELRVREEHSFLPASLNRQASAHPSRNRPMNSAAPRGPKRFERGDGQRGIASNQSSAALRHVTRRPALHFVRPTPIQTPHWYANPLTTGSNYSERALCW